MCTLLLQATVVVNAQVVLVCGGAITIADPGVAQSYTLSGCTSLSPTTITVSASAFSRTVNIEAAGVGSPCFLEKIEVQGVQSNLILNLRGVEMNCPSSACFVMSAATLTSVTVAAESYPSSPAVTNSFTATGNGLITVASANTLSLKFDSSAIACATHVIAASGALNGFTLRLTSSTVDAGVGRFLSATSTVTNVDIGFNSGNLVSATTKVTSTGRMFYFGSTVTAPFEFYSGPGTTFVGQAATTRMLAFLTALDVSGVTVSISSSSLQFISTSDPLISSGGSMSALTLSIYGSSVVSTLGSVLTTTTDLRSSTVALTYLAAGTAIPGSQINVGGAISTLTASFATTAALTVGGFIVASAITSLSATCLSLSSTGAFVEISGANINSGVVFSGTSCGTTGNYIKSTSGSSLASSSINLLSSNMVNAAKTAFEFGGSVATSSITLTSSTVTASKYVAFASSATQVSITSLSSTLIDVGTSVFSFDSTTATSSTVLITAASSSTFSGPTFLSIAYNTNSVFVSLDSSAKIFASSRIVTASALAIVDTLSIIGGTSTTISSGGIGFQVGQVSFVGLALTAAGARYEHASGLALMSIASSGSKAVDFTVSVASGAVLSSPGSVLFSATGTEATDFRLSVTGGTVSLGGFATIATGLMPSSNFIVTTTSNGIVTFSSVMFQASVAVTNAVFQFDSGTTLVAPSGLVKLTATTVTHQSLTFVATDLAGASNLNSAAASLISSTSSISILDVSLSGTLTISTTPNLLDFWVVTDGTIAILNNMVLSSQGSILKVVEAYTSSITVMAGASITSSASHLLTISAADVFTFIGSSASFVSSGRLLDFTSTTASVTISMAGCTLTTSASATLGAFQFGQAASDLQVTIHSASTVSVPSASLLYFSDVLSGTNIISIGGASTVTTPSAAVMECTKGFQGTSLSFLLSSITVTAGNRLLSAAMTATSLGSVISIVSSTITIRTTTTTLDPALVMVTDGPKLSGVLWTVSSCGMTHLIPIVPTNDITLSLFAVVGSSVSITNSIGPSFEVYASSVTSSSVYLSTFLGVRFDGTGTSEGHNDPHGTIVMEQLTYSLSTTKIGLVYASSTFTMRYMNMTFRCVDIQTTSIPPIHLQGLADQVYFNLYGVQIRQTQAAIAAIDASTNALNQYLKFRFLNCLIHTPRIIGIHASLLVANPTPPSVAEIYAGCSRASEGYDMSAYSFGSPLYSAFQALNCEVNKYKDCLDTTSRSRSMSLTTSLSGSTSLTPTESVTASLSDEPTKTFRRTESNYSFSNSSELSMSQSVTDSPSMTATSSDEVSLSRSVTASSSLTWSPTLSFTSSSSLTASPEATPSGTVTGTVTDSQGSRTHTPSMTPSDSVVASDSESRSSSVTSTPSPTTEASSSQSQSKEVSLSSTWTPTPSATASLTNEPSRSKSSSVSETPSGVTPSPMVSASPSASASAQVSLSPTPTSEESSTPSLSPSASVSISPVESETVSRSFGSRTPSLTRSLSISVTLSNDPSRSATLSTSDSLTVSSSSSVTHSPSLSRSLSGDKSVTPTLSPSSTPSRTEEISESSSGSPSPSATVTSSVTATPTSEASATATYSLSVTLSLTPTSELSRSATPSQERSDSRMTGSVSPSVSPSDEHSTSPSNSQTVTLTDVTWSNELTVTTTRTESRSQSGLTSDQTLTASTSTSQTFSITVTTERSRSTSHSDSISSAPSKTETLTGSSSSSSTYTITQTESISAGSFSAEPTYTGLTQIISPTRQTLTLSDSVSKNSRSQNISASHSGHTPSRSIGSMSAQQSVTESNSSSPTEERTKTNSKSPNTHTHTVTDSQSSDVTLTVTRTITPPKTVTDTRSISPGKPAALSSLQQVVNFFADFLADGQACTAGLWFVIGICLLLFLLEAFVILAFRLLGGIFAKHPDTVDGIGVLRSLVARSTYLGALWPCHYRCALPHTAIAILHMTLVMTVYYIASVRLYLSSASPTSLRVIVALGSAVAPHLITNPLRQLLFYYTFNTNKLEKAWLKYCDITGRHQSREYFPTVKNSDPLRKVLDMSKSKTDPLDANISHHRQRHAIESAWRKKVEDDDTFEFDLGMPATSGAAAPRGRGTAAVHIQDVEKTSADTTIGAAKKPKGKGKKKRPAGKKDVSGTTAVQVEDDDAPDQQPIIRVMSVRRAPGASSPSSATGDVFASSGGAHSEEDELPQITIVTDAPPVKKKKKGKKKKATKTKNAAETPQQQPKGVSSSPISLLGVGDFVDSDSDISIDDGAHVVSPSPKAKKKKKGGKKSKASSSDDDFTFASSGKGGSGGGQGKIGDGVGSEIGSLDVNAIFGSAFGGSTSTGGSKPSSRGKQQPDDLSGFVPSIVVSVPQDQLYAGSFIHEHNLDLDFSELGPDEELSEDQRPNTKGGLGLAQREVMAAFATPRGMSPTMSSDGRITAAIFDDVDSMTTPRPRDFPVPAGAASRPKEGTTAFKLLHGIEDPFQASDSDDSSDDEATKRFKKASAPSDLFNENDPFGFASSVRATTADSTGSGGGRRGSQSFKLHPLKDSTVAVIDGGVNNKVVQHNLEDRWERRSDEWSLPSASDSTDTEGDDEEGREYFPAPIVVYHLHVTLGTALLFLLACLALFFTIRGVEQPAQLCITDFLYVTFLVDFFVVECLAALLILFHRVWWFNEDGSHDKKSERHSWRLAIQSCNCTLHPFTGELREHMIPPLRKGKKRFNRDQPYAFGVPVKHQPALEAPKAVPVEHKTRLPKWEEY